MKTRVEITAEAFLHSYLERMRCQRMTRYADVQGYQNWRTEWLIECLARMSRPAYNNGADALEARHYARHGTPLLNP